MCYPQALLGFFTLWSAITCTNVFAQSEQHKLQFTRLSLSYDSVCQPGKVLKLSAVVSNKSEVAYPGLIVVKIVGLGDQQFERTSLFPAQTAQYVDICIPVPLSWREKPNIEFEATLFGNGPAGEIMLDIDGVPLRQSLKIPIDRDPLVVSTSHSPQMQVLPWWYWPNQPADTAYESIVASKIAAGGNRSTLGQRSRPLPAGQSEWNSLDVLVLTDPSPLHDANNLDAIGRFIDGGGTVWAMLDKVPMALLQPLLCPGNSVEELDSVQLRKLTIDVRDRSINTIGVADRRLDLETPATLVRTIQSGGVVDYSTDGWPVVIVFNQGDGRLILSTLEMNAWVQRRTATIVDSRKEADFQPRLWCSSLCKDIVSKPTSKTYPRGTLGYEEPDFGRNYAHSMIGNPVVPRQTVTILLFSFLLTQVVVSTWCWWLGDWQKAVWLTPMVAIVFASGSMLLARNLRQDIPQMLASLTVSHANSLGSSSVVHQQTTLHLANQIDMKLTSSTDGTAWVESNLVTSGVKRIRHSSLDSWTFSNQSWPPGVWGCQLEYVQPLKYQMTEGTFTADGLEVRLPQQLANLEDCVFSLRPGQLMLGKAMSDHWILDGSMPAGAGRWTTAAILSDEQVRRQQVLDDLLIPDSATEGHGWRNRLFGWRDSNSLAVWDSQFTQAGSTLEILPVRLHTPPIQQKIAVPMGLLDICFDRRVNSRSSAFREESGTWEPKATQPSKVSLQFSLPHCLIPFQAQSINLALDISAPRRTVKIWNNASESPRLLATLESPSVPWNETFAADSLSFDNEGAIYLLLEVSDRSDQEIKDLQDSVLNWHVNQFNASCLGHRLSQME